MWGREVLLSWAHGVSLRLCYPLAQHSTVTSGTRRELPLSSCPPFRLVEIMCLPQCLLAGERWRECSRSCLLIRSSLGLVSELWNKWTSVQTSIQAITTPRVCCVHCQPNPEKEDLGFASGELQPVIEKNLKKKLLWPSERFGQVFSWQNMCVYTDTPIYTYI